MKTLDELRRKTTKMSEATEEDKAKQLPEPSGYHILCTVPNIEDKYESGLIKADTTKHFEEVLSTVFFVFI